MTRFELSGADDFRLEHGVQEATRGGAKDLRHKARPFEQAIPQGQAGGRQNLGHDSVLGGDEERAVQPHQKDGQDHQPGAHHGQDSVAWVDGIKPAREGERNEGEAHDSRFDPLPEHEDRPFAESVRQHARQRRKEEKRQDEAGGHQGHDRLFVEPRCLAEPDEDVAREKDGDDVQRLIVERRCELREQ